MRNYCLTIGEYEPAYYELVKETYSFNDCVSELIDNSIDSGGKNIDISILKDVDNTFTLRISDNGCGMSTKDVLNVFNKFISPSHKNDDMIGCKGVGMKCAILSLSNRPYSTCTIRTSRNKDNTLSRLIWNIDINQGVFNKAHVEESVKKTVSNGTTITITNIKHGDINELKEFISSRYSYIVIKKNITITLNNEKVDFFDRMHFSLISKKLNMDGAYYVDNKCFYVHTSESGNKFVFLYIPVKDKKGNRINKGEISTKYGGLYAMKGGRYVNYATNIRDMIGSGGKINGGGAGRLRLLVIVNDNNANKFGVKQNKSGGIMPLKDCLTQSEFKIIKQLYKKMISLHSEIGSGNYALFNSSKLSAYFTNGITLNSDQINKISELANSTECGNEMIKRISDKKVTIVYANSKNKSNVFVIKEHKTYVLLEINKNSLYYEFMTRCLSDNSSDAINRSIEANVLYYYNRFLGVALKNNDKVNYFAIFNKLLKSFGLPCAYEKKF